MWNYSKLVCEKKVILTKDLVYSESVDEKDGINPVEIKKITTKNIT